jgi:hypothetical protein
VEGRGSSSIFKRTYKVGSATKLFLRIGWLAYLLWLGNIYTGSWRMKGITRREAQSCSAYRRTKCNKAKDAVVDTYICRRLRGESDGGRCDNNLLHNDGFLHRNSSEQTVLHTWNLRILLL